MNRTKQPAAKKLSTQAKGNIAVIATMVIFGCVWIFYSNQYSENFQKRPINSVVVDSNDWWKRSMKFTFADGNFVYIVMPVENKLRVGDSIAKPANTSIFEVYRKNDSGNYYFFKRYNNNEAK